MTIFQIIAACVMLALLAYFIFKNRKNIPQHNGGASAENSGIWLERWAYLPEFLSVALTLAWAYSAQRGAIMPFIFCGGFIAFVAFRAIGVPRAVDSFGAAKIGTGAVLSLLAVGSLFVLFSTSVFDLSNNADNEVQANIESSKPALALDAEILQTQERIAALASFSDATKAHNEIEEAKASNAAAVNKKRALYSELSALETKLSNCPQNYFKNCINPLTDKIAKIQTDIEYASGSKSSAYAIKNSEYSGLKLHLVELQKQRANMSESGGGIKSAYKKEDRIIGDFFSIAYSDAASIKWLVFAAVFDLLALLARIGAALLNPSDKRAIIRKKVNAMIDLGIDPLANINAPLQPATVQKTGEIPALEVGGYIEKGGACELHTGEWVLNAAAVSWLESVKKGWLNSANNGVFNMPLNVTRKKGDMCNCADCNAEFTAKHKNHVRCTECGTAVKTSYAKTYKS